MQTLGGGVFGECMHTHTGGVMAISQCLLDGGGPGTFQTVIHGRHPI